MKDAFVPRNISSNDKHYQHRKIFLLVINIVSTPKMIYASDKGCGSKR
jgi:hypothetical protein